MPDREPPEMSDQERRQAEAIGHHVVARLLEVAQNPEAVRGVLDTWTGQVQQVVGRAVLRFLLYVAITAAGFVMLSDKFVSHLKDLFK